jgi:hypothetical protein
MTEHKKHIPKSLEEWLKDNNAILLSEFGKKKDNLDIQYYAFIHKEYSTNSLQLNQYWRN